MSRSDRGRHTVGRSVSLAGLFMAGVMVLATPAPAADTGDVAVRDLPPPLRDQWAALLPQMGPESHCAVAWDSAVDPNRMVMRCSMYVRMSAEGARRALKYCDEDRVRQNVTATCRLVAR